MKTVIYIDGFNLYYRLLKRSPQYKWLNIKLLCENVLIPANQIIEVNYYTARVSSRVSVEAPRDQQI